MKEYSDRNITLGYIGLSYTGMTTTITSNRWPSTLSELAQNLGAKQALAL